MALEDLPRVLQDEVWIAGILTVLDMPETWEWMEEEL